MENITDGPDKTPVKKSFKDLLKPKTPKEVIDRVEIDYLTGKYNSEELARKYNCSRMSILWHRTNRLWKEKLMAAGLEIPKEPHVDAICQPHPEEVWQQIEAAYMSGASINSLSIRFGVGRQWIAYKARRRSWKIFRAKLAEARQEKILGTMSNRMAQFDDISTKFIEAAIEQVRRLLTEIGPLKTLDVEKLDKLVRLHTSLHESIKKIPNSSRKPSVESGGDDDIHPALRPAPILKMGGTNIP